MVKKCARYNIGFRKIATGDGSFLLQLLFTALVVVAGIYLKLNALQWITVTLLASFFLFTGIYRSVAHLLINHDDSISLDRAIRIKAMSNILLVFAAGFTFFSYLIIFVPKIYQLV